MMLDYTLVSAKATYRMPTPRDLPALVRLVQAFYREDQRAAEMPAEQVLATVRELDRNRDRGSVFVFERDGLLLGYSILVQSWSNERGGTILSIDELYVEPAHRRQGIATDFLTLLGKVAPPTVAALQLEVHRGNRAALALYRRLGFEDPGRMVLCRPVGKRGPAQRGDSPDGTAGPASTFSR